MKTTHKTVSQKVYRRAFISVLKTLLLAAFSIGVLMCVSDYPISLRIPDISSDYRPRKNPKVLIRRKRAKTELLTLMDSKKLYLLGSVDECDEAPLDLRCESIRVFNCTHLDDEVDLVANASNCTVEADTSVHHARFLYPVNCAEEIVSSDCHVYRQSFNL